MYRSISELEARALCNVLEIHGGLLNLLWYFWYGKAYFTSKGIGREKANEDRLAVRPTHTCKVANR